MESLYVQDSRARVQAGLSFIKLCTPKQNGKLQVTLLLPVVLICISTGIIYTLCSLQLAGDARR